MDSRSKEIRNEGNGHRLNNERKVKRDISKTTLFIEPQSYLT